MQQDRSARRVIGALIALLLLLATTGAWAGSFRISPTLAEVPPGSSVASFRVTNSGTVALPIQIEAFAWTQEQGADRHVPAADLVIVPRIATIAPGQTQLIRVARRSPSSEREAAYRVHFIELPVAGEAGFVGVRTTVRFDVPLFFAASRTPANLRWELSLSGTTARLAATNEGGRHARLASVRIVDERGALLAERKGPMYVLAGSTARWPLTTHARLVKGDDVVLEIALGSRKETTHLTIR